MRRSLCVAAVAVPVAALVVAGRFLPDPVDVRPERRLTPPSADALLGRDDLGRDILSRLVHGGALTLGLAVTALAITLLLGLAAALVGGWYAERWPGRLLGVGGNALLSFPVLWIPLLVVALLGSGKAALVLALVLVALPDFYWVLHREALALKGEPFVEAARSLDLGTRRILCWELLPHLAPSALVLALLHFRQAVLVVSTVAFLGLGPAPPTPTWGAMISDGRNYFPAAWWIVAFPALALALSIVLAGVLARRLGGRRSPLPIA